MEKRGAVQHTAEPADRRIEDMTPEERLASMRAFAEEQKFIQPGGGELLPPTTGNDGGYNTVFGSSEFQGGPMSFKMAPGYQGNLAPPAYKPTAAESDATPQEKPRRESIFKRLADKLHDGKEHEKHKEGSTKPSGQ